ncbi:MAG: nucleotidyltransferase domain-containing protein [Oscillospiraceae bacterium]|nr:nucleotidyltransferase domain-containing protein [Oscillospiraceae bacterium]
MLTHADICHAVGKAALKYKITNAYYFGSYAKGTQNAESDLDLLVTFAAPSVSLFTIAGIAADLEESLQTNVDVLVWPLPKDTHLQISKVVKCYGA